MLTTGATMANFAGLAAARSWWGERHGVDVDELGLAGLPPVPVFSSGYIHSSAVKALALLGIGRKGVRTFSRDDVGRLDLDALEAALQELTARPAILIANAGEVNSGDFDPIDAMADLARGARRLAARRRRLRPVRARPARRRPGWPRASSAPTR